MNRPHLKLPRPRSLVALVLASALGCGASSTIPDAPPVSRAPAASPIAVGAAAGAPASALSPDLAAAFASAEREAQGHLGVAVIHVESGERAAYHGDERFPMQSVFKLPLAIDVLARVDRGELRLDETMHIRPIDIRPGPDGALADELPESGGDRPLLDLLERVLITSDNTAADTLLERIGGPRRVTERLRGLGIDGIDVSRSEAELMMDFIGVPLHPPRETWTLKAIRGLRPSAEARTKALAVYLADPRDTATPTAMANLLLRVHRQELLSKASSALLVSILERVTTGQDRLKARLPPGTIIAHKTGTSDETDGVAATTNDVGIVTLPGGAGHVVIAAFLSAARGDASARSGALAQVGRAVFDHYTHR